jgi:lipid II:glycine glycyltransferase (peptidoglycan interpeptide bridge formation enzyme)
MTLKQVQETSEIIPVDCFLITCGSTHIASAIIFQVAEKINQVIYWGDNPEWSAFKPMNFLSYKIFEHYSNTPIKVLDIGPSTNNGVPHYGVVEFKESIGCRAILKYTIHKKFSP